MSVLIRKKRPHLNYKTHLYAISMNSEYKEERMDWPTFLHDNQHTAIYEKTFKIEDLKYLPDLAILKAKLTKRRVKFPFGGVDIRNRRFTYQIHVANLGYKESGDWELQIKEDLK